MESPESPVQYLGDVATDGDSWCGKAWGLVYELNRSSAFVTFCVFFYFFLWNVFSMLHDCARTQKWELYNSFSYFF